MIENPDHYIKVGVINPSTQEDFVFRFLNTKMMNRQLISKFERKRVLLREKQNIKAFLSSKEGLIISMLYYFRSKIPDNKYYKEEFSISKYRICSLNLKMTLIWTENMIIIIYSLEVQNIQR
jgi:hypothetical protein